MQLSDKMYVGGEWIDSSSGETIEVMAPATGETIGRVPSANAADVDRAVEAATKAFAAWSQTPAEARSEILNEIARRISANTEALAKIDCRNTGRPIREFLGLDVPVAAEQFRLMAAAARTFFGEFAPYPTGARFVVREPMGVVGQIIPWNVPMIMTAMKLAPALAAGNCVVIKPAEQTPYSILFLAELTKDLLPPGVLNVVTGYGPSAGAPLARHPGISKVAFTGETVTGRLILQYASENIIPATLELGGKGPNVVFPDCNVEKAIEGALMGIMAITGQQCMAGSRLFLHEDIYDRFLGLLVEKAKGIKMGDPADLSTEIGSLISKEQHEKVLNYIEIGKKEGAKVLCGGGAPQGKAFAKGFFVEPTIFGGVNNKMRIAQEEIFGPVLCVLKWKDWDKMIEEANDTPYGLAAGIWTESFAQAYRTARAIKAGSIWVNRYPNFPTGAPFGGFKKSGIGREMAVESLAHYTQTKNVVIDIDPKPLGFYR
jgi:acyl-CoA reductase-like NAD-dependent aldehyde dehydrogenase